MCKTYKYFGAYVVCILMVTIAMISIDMVKYEIPFLYSSFQLHCMHGIMYSGWVYYVMRFDVAFVIKSPVTLIQTHTHKTPLKLKGSMYEKPNHRYTFNFQSFSCQSVLHLFFSWKMQKRRKSSKK